MIAVNTITDAENSILIDFDDFKLKVGRVGHKLLQTDFFTKYEELYTYWICGKLFLSNILKLKLSIAALIKF